MIRPRLAGEERHLVLRNAGLLSQRWTRVVQHSAMELMESRKIIPDLSLLFGNLHDR